MIDPGRPLHRSRRQSLVGGVCAGMAEWAGWDVTVVRAAWILVTVFTGGLPGVLAYVALWLYLAPGPETAGAPPTPTAS